MNELLNKISSIVKDKNLTIDEKKKLIDEVKREKLKVVNK